MASRSPAQSTQGYVADIDQLPSVGPHQFLADLIDAEAAPVIRLAVASPREKQLVETSVPRSAPIKEPTAAIRPTAANIIPSPTASSTRHLMAP